MFVPFAYPLAIMRKEAGESARRNDAGALLKEQKHNFAERFKDSKRIAKQLFLGDSLYV